MLPKALPTAVRVLRAASPCWVPAGSLPHHPYSGHIAPRNAAPRTAPGPPAPGLPPGGSPGGSSGEASECVRGWFPREGLPSVCPPPLSWAGSPDASVGPGLRASPPSFLERPQGSAARGGACCARGALPTPARGPRPPAGVRLHGARLGAWGGAGCWTSGSSSLPFRRRHAQRAPCSSGPLQLKEAR